MIRWLIAWCVRNRLLVCLLTLMLGAAGLWAMLRLPVDAIPDLSDVQVIVYSQWMGRDPQTVEDQVTYPLTTKMLAVPGAKVVRGYSFFGFSLVYVIFEDGTDLYWARSRVLEYLSDMQGRLPEGVVTSLGPDATGVGWVYEYTLENGRYCPRHPQGLFRPRGEAGPYWEEPPAGIETELVRAWLDRERCPLDGTELVRAEYDLGELRALQDWYLRYPLTAVPGVAEVASLGGYERQYQVTVEPSRLQTYGLPLRRVIEAIRRSNNDVGGRLLEIAETEYMVRGRGYLRSLADLEQIPLGVSPQGTPILLRDVATVALGPEVRRGLAEKDGRGQVVAGIVVMRWGENALATIERVKAKLEELQRGLPPGVGVFTAYDRSALIHRAIATLRRQLLEEMAIVALVCVVFLWHARSALVAAVTLPLGILISLLAMVALGINANIMSLGGIAIAIGAMVDASVVLVENAHKRLHERPQEDRWQVIVRASQEVGPALFFSLLVITVSFLPVFALQAQAGRLFKPLAYTKTFAMAAAALLAVTIIPVATALFVRHSLWPAGWSRARGWGVGLVLALGPVLAANLLAPALGWRWWLEQRLVWSAGWLVVAALLLVPQRIRREEDNPLSRLLIRLYMPVIRAVLRHPWAVIAGALLVLAASWLPYRRLGSEFMPPLDEGDILYMPTAVPGISIAAAETTLQIQDQLFKQFPEVDVVLGKIGRAETPTDPAPLTMVETTVTLYPPERWPARKLVEGQLAEPLAELLAAFGPLPARYARDAAAEVEKMALAEFNPRLRRACLEGRALAEAAAELLPELMRFAREQAVAAYRDKLLQWRKERLRAELAAALAAEPLGVRGRLDAGGALVLERQRLAERLGRLHAGAEGAVSELVAHLQEQLAQADDPAAFAAGLEQRLVELVREELPEYLARQGLVRAELDEAALARHLEDALRPERLGPLRLRRVRDLAELMYQEMDPEFQFPGLTNAWTMPIKTRIDMLATGIKTPIGIKVFGPDLAVLEQLAIRIEEVVRRDPGTLSAVAERVFGGNYLDVEIDRAACARHGLTVGEVQDVIETAIGGMNITQTVEGPYRFKVNVRYPRELRDDPVRLARVLVATPLGEQIPLGQLARLEVKGGPPAIKSENAMQMAIVYVDLNAGQDVGSYVARVRRLVEREVAMPPGYYTAWSGQFEYMEAVNRRLRVIVPVTVLIVLVLLYFNFGRLTETLIVLLSLPFAVVGGVWLLYLLGYNLSIAVGVGFIALAGLAAETGVVMLVYLDLAWQQRLERGSPSLGALYDAIVEGAVLRVRPKMMTVVTTILGLLPIMWASGTGAGPMKRLAAPMIGGLISSTVLTLVVIPAIYYLVRRAQHGLGSSRQR